MIANLASDICFMAEERESNLLLKIALLLFSSNVVKVISFLRKVLVLYLKSSCTLKKDSSVVL